MSSTATQGESPDSGTCSLSYRPTAPHVYSSKLFVHGNAAATVNTSPLTSGSSVSASLATCFARSS